MGCLRLTYWQKSLGLKVEKGNLNPLSNSSAGVYRYGFQGQEKDDEIKGSGNSVNYKYRMHDVRTGRFFAVDPLAAKYPYYSSYAFSGNRVIDRVEVGGLYPGLGQLRYAMKSAGISEQKVVGEVKKSMTYAAPIAQDLLIVGAGVGTVLSGGTVPVVIGTIAIIGGGIKLTYDLMGDNSSSDKVQTSVSGWAMVTVNYVVGNEVFSEKTMAITSVVEGVLTLNIKDVRSLQGLKDMKGTAVLADILTVTGIALSIEELSDSGPSTYLYDESQYSKVDKVRVDMHERYEFEKNIENSSEQNTESSSEQNEGGDDDLYVE